MKNLLVILTSIAIMVFVGDQLVTKYNLNPEEPTCIYSDVENTLLGLTTNDLEERLSISGYTLDSRVIRENTMTDKRDITIKGRSKYECSTTIELKLSAEPGNKKAERIIKQISHDDRIKTEEKDYKVAVNDLGTTFFIRALKFPDNLFQSEINYAVMKIKELESKCENLKSIEKTAPEPQSYEENIDTANKLLEIYSSRYNECNDTKSMMTKDEYLSKTKTVQKELSKTKEQWDKENKLILPFIGKRWFNFLGGNGTNESISIKENGNTLIESYGLGGSSIEYNGKFTNPIKIGDSTEYKIEDDKIFLLENGKVSTGCRGDEQELCVETLFEDTSSEKQTKTSIQKDIQLIDSQYGDLGQYNTYILSGNGEQCRVTILHGNKVVDGDCISLTNSKGVKIICTKNKKICKTEQEFSNM